MTEKIKFRGFYDDFIVCVWLDKDGNKKFAKFPASTDPSRKYFEKGNDGKDANEDGRNDIGMLPRGVYRYSTVKELSERLNKKVFKLFEKQKVYRDINHDGIFNEEDEKLVSDKEAMYADDMHIHMGSAIDTWSAECQTMEHSIFDTFSKNIEEGRKAGQMIFTYVLVGEL